MRARDWLPDGPRTLRTLRIMAVGCYVIAALHLTVLLLALVLDYALGGEPPDWNRADKALDALAWVYVGFLHSALAEFAAEERR